MMMMTYEMNRTPYCDDNFINQQGKEQLSTSTPRAIVPKSVIYNDDQSNEHHHRSAENMTDARNMSDNGNVAPFFITSFLVF